ncbi:MAG: polyphosphate kinase 2 family protein [Sedimentisphaerales bacterium]|nr:polyphosphate kinase 2 family protein [Sedimentisphaerales bacterium]
MSDLKNKLAVKANNRLLLKDYDPGDTSGFSQKDASKLTKENIDRLKKFQYLLYAENKHSLLIILQAMDAGGKDGTIRHVLGPLNPQGVRVISFKTPTGEEVSHDFLWRIHQHTPKTGEICIFNRSHYEDVLIARVHNLVPKQIWSKRYKHINSFEKLLLDSGTTIIKFFLNISQKEQLQRLNDRLEDPQKKWKANPQDFVERNYWGEYMKAYESAIQKCSTSYAPWFIIPSDKKWFRNLAVSTILVNTLESLNMKFPHVDITQ